MPGSDFVEKHPSNRHPSRLPRRLCAQIVEKLSEYARQTARYHATYGTASELDPVPSLQNCPRLRAEALSFLAKTSTRSFASVRLTVTTSPSGLSNGIMAF